MPSTTNHTTIAMSRLDRRAFLKIGGAGLFGIAFSPLLGGCRTGPTEPAFTQAGFTPFITPVNRFYLQYGGRDTIAGWQMPEIDRAAWQLKLTGELTTPMTISWSDLQAAARAGHERTILKTMRCVLDSHVRPGATGWTGNAYWTGVPLRHFLDAAGLDRANAKRLVFTGADRFSNNITLERYGLADRGEMDPLLVYEMNGESLTREHGGPVRLIILEGYGYKNIKWLTEVNAYLFNRPTGQYQREGFVDDGVMRVASRSENLSEPITLAQGLVEITGFAVSGAAAISRVEVSIDDAPYVAARIDPYEEVLGSTPLPSDILQLASRDSYPFRGVWTKWRYRWQAPAGEHTVAIRATDLEGNTQPEDDIEIQDGQTGVVRYTVTVS